MKLHLSFTSPAPGRLVIVARGAMGRNEADYLAHVCTSLADIRELAVDLRGLHRLDADAIPLILELRARLDPSVHLELSPLRQRSVALVSRERGAVVAAAIPVASEPHGESPLSHCGTNG